jgi:PQQ-like domain
VSTELDDLFTAWGRQADAIPIGTAAQARHRGDRRRARQRAVLASAAAVVLLLTGAGVLSLRQHRKADPILPATTPARVQGLAPLGEPLPVPAGQHWTAARISGDRVIGLATSEAVAVDTRTGTSLWTLNGTWIGVVATASTVILVRREDVQPEDIKAGQRRVMEFHDPATGADRWELPHTTDDLLVLHQDVLVRLIAGTRRLEARDLVTGKVLWAAASDGSTMISGMRVEADAAEDFYGVGSALYQPESEKAFPYTDDRLVSITPQGRVTIRDIKTGQVRSTAQGQPDPEELSAYEGTVYTVVPAHPGRAPATLSRVLYAPHDPWMWDRTFPCGVTRLCLFEYRYLDPSTEKREAHLVMIDAGTGQVVRTTGAVPVTGVNSVRLGHIMVSGTGLKGTALYDENGEARYSDNGVGGFVDDGNALTLTRDAGDGRFTVRGISNIDFRKVTLGVIPELSGRCDWNDDLLTCPTGKGLHTWRLTR